MTLIPIEEWNHYYMYALGTLLTVFASKRGEPRTIAGTTPVSPIYPGLRTRTAVGKERTVLSSPLAFPYCSCSEARGEKTIEKKFKIEEGIFREGGWGCRPMCRATREKDGKVVDEGVVIPTEQILELLGTGQNAELDRLAEGDDPLKLSDNPSERISQIELLRNKVRAADFESQGCRQHAQPGAEPGQRAGAALRND